MDEVRYTYHTHTNKNGQHLLDLTSDSNLVITNTMFQKRPGKLWTYLSDMSRTKTQIDYIPINKKCKNSVKNIEAFCTFSGLGSDHRIVTARLKLSLRSSKTPSGEKQYDWNILKSDTNLQELYTIAVRNCYEQLYREDETATEDYQHLIDANRQAADGLISPKSKRKKKEIASDHRIDSKRKEVNKAFSAYQNQQTDENHEKLQIARVTEKDI